MSHRKSDLGIPRPRKSAKVVLVFRLIQSHGKVGEGLFCAVAFENDGLGRRGPYEGDPSALIGQRNK
jgi:hypothetical protein